MKKSVFTFLLTISIPVFLVAQETEIKRIKIDIAINGLSAEWINPFNECDEFAINAGAAYILKGIILKGGTIESKCSPDADGFYNCFYNDLGEAEVDDDDVIGEWHCRGWFVQNPDLAKDGILDLSTQIFQFYSEELGEEVNIITDGTVELEYFKEHKRVITGVTGQSKYSKGEVTTMLVGLNEAIGYNMTADIELIINE